MRAYSPKATPRRVLRAVDGANIVIYFGHGTGFPNPYSKTLRPEVENGWGLQGPRARGTHEDDLAKGRLAYYGEAWLAANAHPAPGFVMIYSNACYAPGASEGWLPKPDQSEALTHVANYSRAAFAMGASAYYATDFYGGAARLVHALLDQSGRTFANVFRSEPQFRPGALSRHAHPQVPGTQIWLHRSAYFDGERRLLVCLCRQSDGPHGRCPGRSSGRAPSRRPRRRRSPAWRAAIGSRMASKRRRPWRCRWPSAARRLARPRAGWACARIAAHGCPWSTCATATTERTTQRIVNLSHAAWQLISDKPLAEGVIPVDLYLDGKIPGHAGRTPLMLTIDPKPGPGMKFGDTVVRI